VINERLSGGRTFSGRDPHSALKTEMIAKANIDGMEVVLARLQWGKDDSGYSLHVNPTAFSTTGLQRTDFLAYLGSSAAINAHSPLSNAAMSDGSKKDSIPKSSEPHSSARSPIWNARSADYNLAALR
jgi:hypothetical protein